MRSMRSETIAKLTEALCKVQAELKNVPFDMQNSHFKTRYASLGACINIYRPVLAKHDLFVAQTFDSKDGIVFLITTLFHISGEYLDSIYPILPVKPDPQGYGGAITYARRYTVCALLGLASEEDDDGETAQDRVGGGSRVEYGTHKSSYRPPQGASQTPLPPSTTPQVRASVQRDDVSGAGKFWGESDPTKQPTPTAPTKVGIYRGETTAERDALKKIITDANEFATGGDFEKINPMCVGKTRAEISTIITRYFLKE